MIPISPQATNSGLPASMLKRGATFFAQCACMNCVCRLSHDKHFFSLLTARKSTTAVHRVCSVCMMRVSTFPRAPGCSRLPHALRANRVGNRGSSFEAPCSWALNLGQHSLAGMGPSVGCHAELSRASESAPLYLGIDFGTSGARASVIDGTLRNCLTCAQLLQRDRQLC